MNHFPSATYKLTNFLINFFFIFHFSFLLYTLYNFSIFHIVSYFRLSVIMLSRSTVQWVDWDRGRTGTWIRSNQNNKGIFCLRLPRVQRALAAVFSQGQKSLQLLPPQAHAQNDALLDRRRVAD